MRNKVSFLYGAVLASCLSLPLLAATPKEQMSIDLAIALNGAMEPEKLVVLLIEQKPHLAEDILTSVIETHPDKASTIAQAAISSAPDEQADLLLLTAIKAGIDPTEVGTATAAGIQKAKE